MIDFHSHVLPGVDDGSKSIEESLRMLEASSRQGITTMALTPHFYGDRDTPERFLRRRADAVDRLLQERRPYQPRLLAGAEVYYFPGIQRAEAVSQLRLEGTTYLLVEMPFTAWSERMVRELLDLNQRRGLDVVLAHIDRYLFMNDLKTIERLLEHGIQLQANADSFLNWRQRRKMLRMVKEGWLSFLGSDCHNMTTRPPCLGKAMEVIAQKLGPNALKKLTPENELMLWEEEAIR